MKNRLYSWLWKSHVIAGIIIDPFVLLLSLTGIIYLFKDNYEKELFQTYKTIKPNGKQIPYEEQLKIAKSNWSKNPQAIALPTTKNQSTQFTSGRFSHKSSVYIHPSNGNSFLIFLMLVDDNLQVWHPGCTPQVTNI